MAKENEYKEIFLAEAIESHEELNRLITHLEKNPGDKKTIDSIFRITHTLKGNASGMGFQTIAEFSHVLEDIFSEVRSENLILDKTIYASLFKSVDILGELILAVKEGGKVQFRGIKTKLEVILQSIKKDNETSRHGQIDLQNEIKTSGETDETESANNDGDPVITEHATSQIQENDTLEDGAQGLQENVEKTIASSNDLVLDSLIEPSEEHAQADKNDDSKITFSDHVQVPVRKLDNLLNLVGELIIERDRLIVINNEKTNAKNEYSRLNRISSDLQFSVMDVRLVQVSFLFNKFHRIVRDIANIENKSVTLTLKGTETEIDRNILQIISDSLIHLVRNAIGHGIESIVERKNAGKSTEGNVILSALSESDAVIIEIIDDGKGLNINKIREKAIQRGLITQEEAKLFSDNDIILMIFEPGFSTVDNVNSLSGRGVGMDVVKRAIDSIGGTISVNSERGNGTKFTLRLPSSMAVKGTLLFELKNTTFAIPLSYTEAVVSQYKTDLHKVGNGLVIRYLGNSIPLVFLDDLFGINSHTDIVENKALHKTYDILHAEKKLDIIIVSYNDRLLGIVVDKLLQQKEIVEKPLMKPFDKVKLISGVTIMGNGNVCLVINVAMIFNVIFSKSYTNKKNIKHV